MFSVQVLHTLSGGTGASVYGISDSGDAVGSAGGSSSVCHNGCAVIWSAGMPTALGAVQGAYASGASSINDAGQVVGNVYLNDAYTEEVAVIWNNGATSRNPQWAKVRGRRFFRRMETQNQALYSQPGSAQG
jgi:uncharacterized membrane protein